MYNCMILLRRFFETIPYLTLISLPALTVLPKHKTIPRTPQLGSGLFFPFLIY